MKRNVLPFLFAIGLAAQPALAAGTGGYGMTSGAPAGSIGEAGMPDQQEAMNMPQPQTSGDVTYLCGGIGENESSYMKQQARQYDVMMTFAAQNGAYLANVDVSIARGNEPVLQASCDGPILLVDVARPGNYRITANAGGFTQTRNVRISGTQRQAASIVRLTWPSSAIAQIEAQEPVTTGGAPGTVRGGTGAPKSSW